MDYFKLIRTWFDFAFENPEKIKPNHIALYTFCVEHCNRLGWKQKFGLPTEMAKDAIGIKSYHTYINTLNDLVEYGFIKMIERSKNQYSSNIIALVYFDKALDKALDKASVKHVSKQRQSTYQSIDSIIIQLYKEQLNKEQLKRLKALISKNEKEYKIKGNEIFFENESINNVFHEYLKLRVKEKFTMSQIVTDRLIKKLREYSNNNINDATELVMKAITGKWKDFYPLK